MPKTEETLMLEAEKNRGAEARAILEHELVTAAFDAIEGHYMRQIRSSKIEERSAREESYEMLRILDQFKSLLTRVMETGKLAAATLEQRAEHERALRREGL